MSGMHFSMGFVFCKGGLSVLLLRKARPAFLAGLWMGVTGRVEVGETPLEAMRREAKEEANLDISDWTYLGAVEGKINLDALVHMYATHADLTSAKTMTDEIILRIPVADMAMLPLGPAVYAILPRLRAFLAGESTFDPTPLKNDVVPDVIALSTADAQTFIASLDSPASLNDRLAGALNDHVSARRVSAALKSDTARVASTPKPTSGQHT